uniref:Uncharacterized protein n=1 Tax=Tanacetum cinerariifolium TaxID=118510 RepID=A0A6L2LEI0_TANCI|nr:hypothetical protein [Tanacetum cinerariifolium]
MQTQTSNTLHNAIMEAGSKDRPSMLAPDMEVPVFEGSPVTRTESQMETYKTVSQDIRDQLNAEAEVVQIILTWIDNDIYSTVDACPNTCEMWKAIKRLKHDESINVQDLETNLYWEFGKFTSQDVETLESYYSRFYKMLNELIRNQCDVTNHQDKEIDKLMALISLSFNKIYKPTNNNLRTSSNTSRANQDNSPRINRGTGYENQRIGNVAGARETVEDQELKAHYMYMSQLQEVYPDVADSEPIFDDEPLQKLSNNDHYNVFAIESEHPEQSKSVHDTYPIEQDTHNVIIDSLDMSYDREEIDKNDDDNDLANEQIVLFIVDSGCSKHMTRNLKLLINFVEKFLGTIKLGNDQIAPILGYGDLGNDLLTGSRSTDLYSITLQDTNCPNPICLMAKATSSQAWLWHRRLSHLNFDTINLLSKNDIVVGLPKLKFVKDHLCSFLCINGKRYGLVIIDDCSRYTWTHFLRSKDETPKVLINFLRLVQRGLQAQKGFFTKHPLLEHLNKTTLSKDGIEHLLRDGENLDKRRKKVMHVSSWGYSTQSRACRVFNKRTRVIMESIYVNFNELPHMASDHVSSDPAPECQRMALEHDSLSLAIQRQENVPQAVRTVTTSNELDLLFSLMFDELLNGSSKVVSKSFVVSSTDAPNQRQQHTTLLNNHTTPAPTCQVLTLAPTVTSSENMNQAETYAENDQVADDEFINIFCTLVQDRGETSSQQVIGNPSQSVRTRRQLESDGEMYGFVDPYHPDKVYRLKKALYGLKQAPRECIGTPMATKHLDADLSGTPVDQMKYRRQSTEKHLTVVKRIFQYLKDTIHMGLWYPKDTGFELTAFSDSDHAGCLDSRKSTSGEAEYVSLSACCAQVL